MINKTLSFALIALVVCACKKPVKTYEIKAPFKNVALNSTTKTINPAEAQVVKFDKGFSVEVPQNAFKDADGNLITEPVARTVYSLPSVVVACMSTPVLSTIASVIWLAIVRFQIIV